MEWKRSAPYLIVRIAAVIILMVSVGGLIVRPSLKTEKSANSALLTARYQTEKIDSVTKLHPGIKLYHTHDTQPYNGSSEIKSPHELSGKNFQFIFGEGLTSAMLEILPLKNFHFLPAAYPYGIVQLSIRSPVIVKRSATIEGIFNNAGEKSKLYLEGPGGKEDSITISGKGFQPFKLSFTPKTSGEALYVITSSNGLKEALPVFVEERKSLNILFIQQYPTFETRYLKEFLSDDHQLLFRYQLSKNTYRYEYVNRESQKVERLTEESLSSFDLLIIDTDALQSLSSVESKNLRNTIQSGLGMLVLFNENPAKLKQLKTFLSVNFNTFSTDTAHFSLSGKKIILPVWPLVVKADRIVPTLKNKSRVLSGYQYQGFGKIGFQLLQGTYKLFLEGDSVSYNTLWSGLLEQTARSDKNKFVISDLNLFPRYVNEPIQFQLTASRATPEVKKNNISIPLTEDLNIDDLWHGKIWDDQSGWHSLTVNGDSTNSNYYISEQNSWSSLNAANKINQTLLIATFEKTKSATINIWKPISPWIFYLIFLLSAGFLWFAPKL